VNREETLRETYRAFNERDIGAVLGVMHPDVNWPNAWEGGRVVGRDAVRDYWARQFEQISSTVEPQSFTEEPDGAITVEVDQVVRDATSGDRIGNPESAIATGSTTPASSHGWTCSTIRALLRGAAARSPRRSSVSSGLARSRRLRRRGDGPSCGRGCRSAWTDGEGQNRTGDTTIFSQGSGTVDFVVAAGTFLIRSGAELPLVSCGFPWV
jgi:ketosteroid isomerase-like protein